MFIAHMDYFHFFHDPGVIRLLLSVGHSFSLWLCQRSKHRYIRQTLKAPTYLQFIYMQAPC